VSQGPDLRWRLRWAGIGALVAPLLVALTWMLASIVRSPQDVLAEASAPPPSQITFPVERRSLDTTVVATATLDTATSVTGQLPIDDRARAQQAAQVVVTVLSGRVDAVLGAVRADGTFTVRLRQPVPDARGTTAEVRFISDHQAETGLVVPISALFTAADGTVAVVVVDGDHAEHQLSVTMGVQAGGFVEVTPVEAGQIEEGDLVLVSEPRS
jgi:hypothetical protein